MSEVRMTGDAGRGENGRPTALRARITALNSMPLVHRFHKDIDDDSRTWFLEAVPTFDPEWVSTDWYIAQGQTPELSLQEHA